jgi:hypothetical protein
MTSTVLGSTSGVPRQVIVGRRRMKLLFEAALAKLMPARNALIMRRALYEAEGHKSGQ